MEARKLCIALVLVAALAFTTFAASPEVQSKADLFASKFAERLRNAEIEVTEEEEQALRDAHPVLLRVLDSDYASRHVLPDFWKMVRQEKPLDIEWEEARKLILSGKVTEAGTTHAGQAGLKTRDGKNYWTRPSKPAELHRVIREVDPKGVFIRIWTE